MIVVALCCSLVPLDDICELQVPGKIMAMLQLQLAALWLESSEGQMGMQVIDGVVCLDCAMHQWSPLLAAARVVCWQPALTVFLCSYSPASVLYCCPAVPGHLSCVSVQLFPASVSSVGCIVPQLAND
jgi:hypothetical protein